MAANDTGLNRVDEFLGDRQALRGKAYQAAEQLLRTEGRDRVDHAGSAPPPQAPDASRQAVTQDAFRLSEEAVEQLSPERRVGPASRLDPDRQLLDAIRENIRRGPQGQQPPAGEARGVAQKKKIKVEEVKVHWAPRMEKDEIVETGKPWGHFQITRQVKEMDAPDKKGQGDRPEGGPTAKGGQGAAIQGQGGASPQQPAGGEEQPEDATKAATDMPGAANAPRTADGMLRVKEGARSADDAQGGGSSQIVLGQGQKVYITDEGTGQQQEVPENGDLEALHPYKIQSFGKIGQLESGDRLFTYSFPNVQDRQKNVDRGLQEPEEGQSREQPQEVRPMRESSRQSAPPPGLEASRPGQDPPGRGQDAARPGQDARREG